MALARKTVVKTAPAPATDPDLQTLMGRLKGLGTPAAPTDARLAARQVLLVHKGVPMFWIQPSANGNLSFTLTDGNVRIGGVVMYKDKTGTIQLPLLTALEVYSRLEALGYPPSDLSARLAGMGEGWEALIDAASKVVPKPKK